MKAVAMKSEQVFYSGKVYLGFSRYKGARVTRSFENKIVTYSLEHLPTDRPLS